MNQQTPIRASGSLFERAAEVYDFGAALRRQSQPEAPAPEPQPAPRPQPRASKHPVATIDRDGLREAGFILPDAPVGGLAEEFRIVKRHLLLAAAGGEGEEKRRIVLLCSAQPNEGKTFCAINLALSLAGERDLEVLLVDGDFAKPEILSLLGIEGGPGLIDAIADPSANVEDFIIPTDIEGLSVLPAGRH